MSTHTRDAADEVIHGVIDITIGKLNGILCDGVLDLTEARRVLGLFSTECRCVFEIESELEQYAKELYEQTKDAGNQRSVKRGQ